MQLPIFDMYSILDFVSLKETYLFLNNSICGIT